MAAYSTGAQIGDILGHDAPDTLREPLVPKFVNAKALIRGADTPDIGFHALIAKHGPAAISIAHDATTARGGDGRDEYDRQHHPDDDFRPNASRRQAALCRDRGLLNLSGAHTGLFSSLYDASPRDENGERHRNDKIFHDGSPKVFSPARHHNFKRS